jgi:hypothetical protein
MPLSNTFSSGAARQKTPGSDPMESVRDEIREKGLAVWAHEQKMEALKARLRAQILADMKLDEKAIAAMPSEKRLAVEAEIDKLIAEKLEEAMKAAVEEAAKTGKTTAILVDVAV